MLWETIVEIWQKDERIRRYIWVAVGALVLVFGYALYRESKKAKRAPSGEMMLLQAVSMMANPQQIRQADSLLASIVAQFPGSVEGYRAQYYRAYVKLQQGNLEEAKEALEAFLKNPLQDPLLRAEAYGHLGTIFAAQKQWDEAMRAVEEARQLAPLKSLKAFYSLRKAEIAFAAGRYPEVIQVVNTMEKEYGRTILFLQEGRPLRNMAQGLLKATGG